MWMPFGRGLDLITLGLKCAKSGFQIGGAGQPRRFQAALSEIWVFVDIGGRGGGG